MRFNIYSFIEVGCAPIILIATTPILVAKLGPESYSVVAATQALAALGSIASVGITTSTMKSVAEGKIISIEAAKLKAKRVNSLLNGIVCVVVFLVTAAWLLAETIGFSSPALTPVAVFSSVLLFVALQYDQYFAGCLKGFGRYQDVAFGELVGRAPAYVCAALAASQLGATGVCLFIAMAPVISALMKSALLMRSLGTGWFSRSFHIINIDKELLRFSLWTWVQNICSIGSAAVDRIVIGSHSGLVLMTFYSATLQIAQAIHTGANAAIQPSLPELTKIARTNRREELVRAIKGQVLGGCAIVAILTLSVALYVWWQSPQLYPGIAETDRAAPYLLIISVSILSMNIVAYYALIVLDAVHSASITNCLASAGFLAALLLLTPSNLSEVSWARLAYSISTLALYPILFFKLKAYGIKD